MKNKIAKLFVYLYNNMLEALANMSYNYYRY